MSLEESHAAADHVEAHIAELDAEELETRVERQSAQEGLAEALW